MADRQQHHGGDTSKRGFASMDEDKQREIASKGGQSVPAQERSFSKDHQLAAEAGRKGGQASHGGGSHASGRDSSGGQGAQASSRGGGSFAQDRERASEAGKKGGHSSHGGRK